jgi:WD40 repeat protein
MHFRWAIVSAMACLAGCGGGPVATPQAPQPAPVLPPVGDAVMLTPGPALPKHGKGVVAAAISSDGRRVATIGNEGKLKVSDAATGELTFEKQLGLPDEFTLSPLVHAAFAPTGYLLAATVDERVRLFDGAGGELLRTLEPEGFESVGRLRFTRTGERLVALDRRKAVVWKVADGSLAASFEIAEPSATFVLTPDDRSLVAAGPEHSIAFYDLADGRITRRLEGTGAALQSLAIDPTGTLLAHSNSNGKFRLDDLATDKSRYQSEHGSYKSLAFSPDGLLAKGYYLIELDLVEPAGLRIVATDPMTRYAEAREPSFSADGRRFVVCDGVERAARLYRLERSSEIHLITCAKGVRGCAVAPDGNRVAYLDEAGLSLYSVADGRVLKTVPISFELSERHRLEFSPDGKRLARIVLDPSGHEFEIYDAATLERKALLRPERRPAYSDACFAPDGASFLLLGTESKSWEFSADRLLPWQHSADGSRMKFTRGAENRLFVGDSGNRVAVYDWPVCRELIAWDIGHRFDDFAVAPDGRLVATFYSFDRLVRLWDATTGKLVREITADAEGVTAAAFSPDGKSLITAGRKYRLSIWSTDGGRLLADCPAHGESSAQSIHVVPGSGRFFTANGIYVKHPSIKQWDLAKLLERAAPEQPPR